MRYFMLAVPVIALSIYIQNKENTVSTLFNIEPSCDSANTSYNIILGSNLDHIQNQRIAYAKNDHTNTTKYLFIGKHDEQTNFVSQMNKVFSNKSKPNMQVIRFDSENTAQHIMCMFLHFMLTNIELNCNMSLNYVNISDIDKGILYIDLPKINIYTNDYHRERFMRTFQIIKSQLRFIGFNVNSTNMNIIEAVTVNHHKGWLTKLETDIHNHNIISDIEKSKESKCGHFIFN